MTKSNKELEDGSFEVRIPLSEKLKGKDLVAYYVDNNGNKEEHEVTIKDGYMEKECKYYCKNVEKLEKYIF